jgi:hypothetical protein
VAQRQGSIAQYRRNSATGAGALLFLDRFPARDPVFGRQRHMRNEFLFRGKSAQIRTVFAEHDPDRSYTHGINPARNRIRSEAGLGRAATDGSAPYGMDRKRREAVLCNPLPEPTGAGWARSKALDTVWKHPVLWKPQSLSAAIRYVVDEPGNPMAVFRDYRNLKKDRSYAVAARQKLGNYRRLSRSGTDPSVALGR